MLVENWYAAVDAEGFVAQFESAIEDSDGPAVPISGTYIYRKLPGLPPTTSQPTAHHMMTWPDGAAAPDWSDQRTIEDAIAAAIIDVDREADTSRASVVGDPVRVKEYERAQQQAEAFRDAGFTGAAPSCVDCWAVAKEWTAQQAAEDILAASARWLGALDGIRALRLQAKEDIRRATSNAQVDALLATFTATLTAAMIGVQ